ncbi:MAG: xanthine dehydrogenase family protein molybdopterin-binding subunit [Wenzhouxiangellaceae bacterium]
MEQADDVVELPRRRFIKQCVVAGITLYTAPLSWAGPAQTGAQTGPGAATNPAWRMDGIAKVTGQKLFSRDIRARDLAGWPQQQTYAYIVRATTIDRRYRGLDLSALDQNSQPYRIIDAADLQREQIELPEWYGSDPLVSMDQAPQYYGHAVAILLFDSHGAFKRAKRALQFRPEVVQYGAEVTPQQHDPYATWRIIRQQGEAGRQGEDHYSVMRDGLIFPSYQNHRPQWPAQGDIDGDATARGMHYANAIAQQMRAHQDDWLIIDHAYTTDSVEPMMMEAESFNGWWDQATKTLHMIASTQSPQDFQTLTAQMIARSRLAPGIKNIVVHSAFIGGGFGGKDHTIFPYYGAIASLFADGRPVLLANDRYEQFQAGLKRHPFVMHNQLAFDQRNGRIQALRSDMELDGGGRRNYSSTVAMVGASAIQSVYYLPCNDIQAVARRTQNVDCGSMRGFGTLQTMTAMEMMLNEAADKLALDPIELRLRNVMRSGDHNTQGAVPVGELRYADMLDLARQHPLWTEREQRKRAYEQNHPEYAYGTGFGIASKDYGTGAVAPTSAIRLTPQGEIELDIAFVEMGTGTQTAQAQAVRPILGRAAQRVNLATTDAWHALQLIETDDPYQISQQKQEEMARNPRWTPMITMPSIASMSAFFQSHTTCQAARILYRYGLWPAAQKLWKLSPDQAATAQDKVQWENGNLTLAGKPPLPLTELASIAHQHGLVTGVMTHAFNRWQWASAEFEIFGDRITLELDALALQYGEGAAPERQQLMTSHGYHLLDRQRADYPPTVLANAMVRYYAPAATIADVRVHRRSGEVRVIATHTWLDCGTPLVPALVEGQIEGGVAMGISHALYESLPLGADGAGSGRWNLDRYHVARGSEVGVWQHSHTLLPPLSPDTPSKGIGEVVMIPVVPAIAEAIYQATAVRLRSTPFSADKIQQAMRT